MAYEIDSDFVVDTRDVKDFDKYEKIIIEIQDAKNLELSVIKSSFKCQLKANRFNSKIEATATNMLKLKKSQDVVKMKRKAFEMLQSKLKNAKIDDLRQVFKEMFIKPKIEDEIYS